MNAEQSRQEGCGKFGGEAEQCGGACLAGAESELAQSLGQAIGADWLAGLPAGNSQREVPGPPGPSTMTRG